MTNPTPAPATCPACGAAIRAIYNNNSGYIPAKCGAVWGIKEGSWGGRCVNAFDSAVARGRELEGAFQADKTLEYHLEYLSKKLSELELETPTLRAELERAKAAFEQLKHDSNVYIESLIQQRDKAREALSWWESDSVASMTRESIQETEIEVSVLRARLDRVTEAAKPIVSYDMLRHLEGLDDSTKIKIQADFLNGYTKWITLGKLRQLSAALSADAPAPEGGYRELFVGEIIGKQDEWWDDREETWDQILDIAGERLEPGMRVRRKVSAPAPEGEAP